MLYLSTALALWWYKQQLQEEANATGQTELYQTQFQNTQPQSQGQIPVYPTTQIQIPQYPQAEYPKSPPPYPETKIDLAQQ